VDVLDPAYAGSVYADADQPLRERCLAAEAELDRLRAQAEDVERLRAQVRRLEREKRKLKWAACHDELTGLPNRRLFAQLAEAKMNPEIASAILLLDLNGFKPINDSYGHETGDRVLSIIGGRLADCLYDDRDGCLSPGMVARLGGDEFAGIVTYPRPNAPSLWWRPVVGMLHKAIAEPMHVAGRTLNVTASIGVAPARNEIAVGELLHRADMAMYQAKIHGKAFATWSVEGCPAVKGGRHTEPDPDAARVEGAPSINPYQRNPADIAPAGGYHQSDPVWVHRHGTWLPGIVESASRRAVMATYRRNPAAGTVVDTMGAECVMARTSFDAHLDRPPVPRNSAA
jgi:diguanylate cyclase (GGDEF)-like protein